VILSKFWSRYDLQNFRKRKFLGDDQGELSKGTVQGCSKSRALRAVVLNLVRVLHSCTSCSTNYPQYLATAVHVGGAGPLVVAGILNHRLSRTMVGFTSVLTSARLHSCAFAVNRRG
jgi:hypothetical protein